MADILHRTEIKARIAEWERARDAQFAAADLNVEAVRRDLTPLHPMCQREYFNDTPETAAFYDIVFDLALARRSGLYVTGEFRVGKTKSIESAIQRLARDLPTMGVRYYSATRQHGQSKSAFCKEMLTSFGFQVSRYQNAVDLLSRVLMVTAIEAGSKSCLLLIDEAQMLTVMQLRYLLEIWNDLDKEKVVLVTILVGQKNLIALKQLTAEADHGAVVARFFTKTFELGGLHSKADVKDYLAAYDSTLVYPLASAWPYTRYFCRQAFDAGWRLAQEGERLWNALVSFSHADPQLLQTSGFRLAFVTYAIESFLLDAMSVDRRGFRGTQALWLETVVASAAREQFIAQSHAGVP